MKDYEGEFENNNIHRLMPHSRRPYGHPVSRDWEDIDCKAVGCLFNRNEKCMTPSQCKINANGQCTGFRSPRLPKKWMEIKYYVSFFILFVVNLFFHWSILFQFRNDFFVFDRKVKR